MIREGQTATPGCDPDVIARIIDAMLEALSARDYERAANAFTASPLLSLDSRPRGTAYVLTGGHEGLLAFFAEADDTGKSRRWSVSPSATAGRGQDSGSSCEERPTM